jgi:hypothetical protein
MKSSLFCNLGGQNFFTNNIHRENYHFIHSKKLKTPIIPPYYRWVVLCTVKNLIHHLLHRWGLSGFGLLLLGHSSPAMRL